MLLEQANCLLAVGSGQDRIACSLQHADGEVLHHRLVFGQQERLVTASNSRLPGGVGGRFDVAVDGQVDPNVVPRCGSLYTWMTP